MCVHLYLNQKDSGSFAHGQHMVIVYIRIHLYMYTQRYMCRDIAQAQLLKITILKPVKLAIIHFYLCEIIHDARLP